MAMLDTALLLLLEHSSTILCGLGISFIIYLISIPLTRTREKNPFSEDSRRPHQGFIHDRALRDKVIKQGFARKKIPENIDAVFIGSGIASLTTAVTLAKTGKKVLVLEQHDQAGGCCHTFFGEGFEFDAGIHYVGRMQEDSLARTVIEQISEGQMQWAPLDDNFDTIAIGRGDDTKLYPLIWGDKGLKESILAHFPGERKAIDTFFKAFKEAGDSFRFVGVLKMIPKWLANLVIKLRLLNIFTSYPMYAALNTQEYIDSLTDNPHLKTIFSYIGIVIGMIPGDSSVLVTSMLLNHFTTQSSYPVGGSSEVAMTVVPVIEKYGGKVLVRASVTDILIENGKAVGVRVKKGGEHVEIRAGMVISGCGVTNTMRLLPEAVAASTGIPQMLDEGLIKHGVGGFLMFVGFDGTKESLNLSSTNLITFPDADWDTASRKFFDEGLDFDNPKDFPALYMSFQSVKDVAWSERYPGKSSCTVLGFVNWEWFKDWENEKIKHRGETYESLKDFLSKRMLAQLFKFFPQLEDKVTHLDVGTPVTNNYYIRANAGEWFGLTHDQSRFKPEVAVNIRPDIGVPGLFLTGQDIAFTGISGAMSSGIFTASAVLKRNVFRDVNQLQKSIAKKEFRGANNRWKRQERTSNGVATNGHTDNGVAANGHTGNGVA